MDADFFRANRARLVEQLSGGNVVLTAYTATQKSGDMANDFLQEANFWYLTGIERPDWWLIIDGTRRKSWLVAPTRDAVHAIFDGSLSYDEARVRSGVDEVVDRREGERIIHDLARTHPLVHTVGDPVHAEHFDFVCNPAPKKMYDMLSRIFRTVQDCQKDLARLRARKQPSEIAAIKRAIKLTCQTFSEVRSKLDALKYEYELEAEFTYRFRSKNAAHAYEPIVAAGGNACTLHYIENTARLHKGQLVLLDIGARVDGYAADITRTYAYGSPTKRAQQIHEALQTAQKEIVGLLEPHMPVAEYLRNVDSTMKKYLHELGLITGPHDDEGYRKYMPHAISHGLGIDVHDSLGAPRLFESGMVLTVEPGIYVPEENIGVRIEDDILITPDRNENLSRNLPAAW